MTIPARRNMHGNFESCQCSNLALRISRHNSNIDSDKGEHQAKDQALDHMAAFRISGEAMTAYKKSYERLCEATMARDDCLFFEIETVSRVLLGTGNASVFEFGFNLNYPWGIPYISGSTLKGAVSSYLSRNGGEAWRRQAQNPAIKSDAQVELFGGIRRAQTKDKKSYIGSLIFHDAWLSPWGHRSNSRGDWFDPDIINPHYPEYYRRNRMPDGMDNPVPIKMAALRPGLKFSVVIQGPKDHCELAKRVLISLLQDEGIGGKTSAGYGRFAYLPSGQERLESCRAAILKVSSPQELLSLYTEYKKESGLHSVFVQALNRFEYSSELESMWKIIRPLGFLLNLVRQGNINSLKDLNKRFNDLKNVIARWQSDAGINEVRKSEDAQSLFKAMCENWREDIMEGRDLKIVKELSFSWEDTDHSADELMGIVENKDWTWPPLSELRAYLEGNEMPFDDEEKELILLALEEQNF